jgi:hypothetical protein
MPTITALKVSQISTSSDGATANMQMTYNIDGPQTEVDFVQCYAINAAAADASLTGPSNWVADYDVTPPDPSYYQTFQLAAGTIYTVFLCPRTGSQDSPDDEFNGDSWEASCVFTQATTTTTQPSGAGMVPPEITSSMPRPASMTQGNNVQLSWSTPSTYQKFIVVPTYDGQALQQAELTGNPAGNSLTYATAPNASYTFAVEGGVSTGWGYNYSGFGRTIKVTSAQNLHSLRQFLQYSGIDPTGKMLSSIKPAADSLRKFMQL